MLVYTGGIEYFVKLNITVRYENEHSQHDLLYVHIVPCMFTLIMNCHIVSVSFEAHR